MPTSGMEKKNKLVAHWLSLMDFSNMQIFNIQYQNNFTTVNKNAWINVMNLSIPKVNPLTVHGQVGGERCKMTEGAVHLSCLWTVTGSWTLSLSIQWDRREKQEQQGWHQTDRWNMQDSHLCFMSYHLQWQPASVRSTGTSSFPALGYWLLWWNILSFQAEKSNWKPNLGWLV